MAKTLCEKEKNSWLSQFSPLFYTLFSRRFPSTGSFNLGAAWQRINSLPNDKILDRSRLKAFADDKINQI